MERFDLIEYQELARSIQSPQKLFALWDEVCRYYDKGRIGLYELNEMKDIIMPTMHSLCWLQSQVEGAPRMQRQTSNRLIFEV